MQDKSVWSWSEGFTEILEGLMREPPSEGVAPMHWNEHRERLGWWWRQVDAARELYRQGHAESLRVLYDYWRSLADDGRDQASVGCETYHQVHFSAKA
jgi:hypothetical protein